MVVVCNNQNHIYIHVVGTSAPAEQILLQGTRGKLDPDPLKKIPVPDAQFCPFITL